MPVVYTNFMDNEQGWISSNREWAAVPYGEKYMLIYKGQQISVHKTLEIAKKTALRGKK